MTAEAAVTAPGALVKPTRIRHIVLLLTVSVYLITYLDRVLLANAIPTIQKEFGISIVTVGWILTCQQVAYTLFQMPGGWLGDRFGPRRALTFVVLWWSVFTVIMGFASSVLGLAVCLFFFGAGEAGAFPIATRSLSRWILPSERGFAQGATHAGSRLGSAVAPLIVVYLIAHYSWHTPFFVFAIIGVAWSAIWYWFYRDSPSEQPSVNQAERTLIHDAIGNVTGRAKSIPWRLIFASPQMWILATMYFCYGCNMSFFLSWFPKYLSSARGYGLAQMGFFASLPLAAGMVGDICGGLFSDLIIKRTGNISLGRRSVACTGFVIAAIFMPLGCLAATPYASAAYFAIGLFGLELTVGNSWAVTLDIGGSYAGSVSAVMNTMGNAGGAIATGLTAYVVKYFGWNDFFYVLSAIALIGAALFVRIDASRQLYLPKATQRSA